MRTISNMEIVHLFWTGEISVIRTLLKRYRALLTQSVRLLSFEPISEPEAETAIEHACRLFVEIDTPNRYIYGDTPVKIISSVFVMMVEDVFKLTDLESKELLVDRQRLAIDAFRFIINITEKREIDMREGFSLVHIFSMNDFYVRKYSTIRFITSVFTGQSIAFLRQGVYEKYIQGMIGKAFIELHTRRYEFKDLFEIKAFLNNYCIVQSRIYLGAGKN